MAFKKTVKTPQGIEIVDAYFRVVNVMINGKTGMQFVIAYSKDDKSLAINSFAYDCAYDIQGDNPIRQAYKYAKTLPEFTDAVDC